MSEITLEKVDMVKDRMYVTYAEAKEALEKNDGDVLDAIVYLEQKIKAESVENNESAEEESETCETVDDFKVWLKDLINKGNVNRVKIKKDEKVLIDIPVNAGIAAGVIAAVIPQLLVIGVITAVATKLTIEITKDDGTVEVVNKVVKDVAEDVSKKTKDIVNSVKKKAGMVKSTMENGKSVHKEENSDHIYSYTVKFDEEK